MGDNRRSAPRLSRRATLRLGVGALAGVVAGSAGLAAVEERVLPGRSRLNQALGMQGSSAAIPDVQPGELVSGSFVSAARAGKATGWSIARPVGARQRLPAVIVLHGLGDDHTSAFADLGLDRFLTQTVLDGTPPFALVSVDGGSSYWHRRASGEDAGAMVLDELIPLAERAGLDVSRVGFLGWSMGGYGSLLLGARRGPQRVAAIGAMSPALWTRAADTAPGAFDDAADFAANTVFGREAALSAIPLRIDCGTDDPFCRATRAFVGKLDPPAAGGFPVGAHNADFWRRMAPEQLRFLGHALHR